MQYVGFFDGAITKNPGGEMGVGAFVNLDGKMIWNLSKKITESKKNTNSVAEYMALNCLLDYFLSKKLKDADILIYGDSEFVILQMKGEYKLNKGKPYSKYGAMAKKKALKFSDIKFQWIPREENQKADDLSKGKC